MPLYFTVLRKCSLVVCSTSPSVCHLFSVLLVGSLSLEPCSIARLAQSVERKALDLVVVGSSPTIGDLLIAQLVARRSHNPKVVSSILTGRICESRRARGAQISTKLRSATP